MRQLHPTFDADVDPAVAYGTVERPAPPDRPWVLVNMVTSLDGATAVEGVSGALGGEADRAVFGVLRALPDVVLAAAGTVRAEDYGPPRTTAEQGEAREARGQARRPRLAVVTASLDLDPGARLFSHATEPPLVITTLDSDPGRKERLAEVAEVIEAGEGRVDLGLALAGLAARGHGVVLCEGGPSLNGQLMALDLVDEVSLTVAPDLVAGRSARMAHGDAAVHLALHLAHVFEQDGVLVLHYLRQR